VKTVEDPGSFIEGSVLEANMYMLRKIVGEKYCGLLSTYSILSCHRDQTPITDIRKKIQEGKIFVQPLYNGEGHFVAVTATALSRARLLDSIGFEPSDLLKLQIWTLLGVEGETLELEMPSVHRQELGGNSCLICASAFVIDTVNEKDPVAAAYASTEALRRWQLHVLRTGEMIEPPRARKSAYRVINRTNPAREKITITSEEAANIRLRLMAAKKLPKNPTGYAQEFDDGRIVYS
jgi:hypothetical protein